MRWSRSVATGALAEAAEADAMLAAGKVKGPLHGVPLAPPRTLSIPKASYRQAAALGRKDYVPGKRCDRSSRACAAAGAILLGKTNTPEFTLGGGGRGTVNLVYGLTKNPYNLNYQPSGSSGRRRRHRRRVWLGVRSRQRLRRLDPRSCVRERHRRHQADARPRAAHRAHRRVRRGVRFVPGNRPARPSCRGSRRC